MTAIWNCPKIYISNAPNDVIKNWMRSRETLEFLGLWETLHNPDFKPVEFDGFRKEAGLHAFTMSPSKWIESVNAIGITTKAGRYGGTYAHSDIALEFASWISAEFKLYIVKDYQRIKHDENSRLSLNWNLNREVAKLNYRIHTDAIKENLIPPDLTPEQISYKYANEADMLNVALFGKTAKQWRDENPDKKGNIRDDANLNQLLVLANMESYNARNTYLMDIRTIDKREKNDRQKTNNCSNHCFRTGSFGWMWEKSKSNRYAI